MKSPFALAIHGGAGTIMPEHMTPEKERAYQETLEASLAAGYAVLHKGGDSLLAVEHAVTVLENSDLFNAGKGSVFTAEGTHELEASIMCGHSLQAGAVAGVQGIKNPVSLSRKVLDSEEFVFLSGAGAEEFAQLHALEQAPEAYFYSEHRYQQWQAMREQGGVALDHSDERKFGTVGAVAVDQAGHLAAATSTGGLTNKKYGRIGDSSVIGSGVYANDATCAISCTGYGEFFLRGVVAYDISCLMEYKGLTLQAAAERVIMEKQTALGGEGGIIGVDGQGQVSLVFNSLGMYRGQIDAAGKPRVSIYKD